MGVFGELHPQTREKLGIDKRIYVAELDYDAIDLLLTGKIGYKHISRFPSVERDLALIADIDTPNAEIVKLICARGGKNLQSVKLFDVYTGKGVEEGKKSVAYAVSFRASDRNLTNEEINVVFDKILKKLEAGVSAQLR